MLPAGSDYSSEATVRAQAVLDEAIYSLQAEVSRSTEAMEALAAETPPLPEEQVTKIRDMYLQGPCADSWRAVAEKVNRGELTWRGIAEGEAFSDPDVAAAFTASLQYAREHPDQVPAELQEVASQSAEAPSNGNDEDDEFFTSGGYLRG